MIQISDNVKLEENGKNFVLNIPEDSKEEIKLNLDKEVEIKIIVGKSSEVKVVSFSKKNKNVEIDVDDNGKIDWIDFSLGEGVKSYVKTNLNGINSEGNSLNIVFGDNSSEFELDNKVVHKGNNSKSDMVVRAVMNEKAKVMQTGLVKVSKNAVNCEGYQKSDVILLSEDAYAEAVPNLEIENNEVKCSHGATVSQIDEDKLFYLQSRGLSLKEAKRVIVEGFFEPVLKEFEGLREEIMERVDNLE
ncbi:MAG: hypothetical protein CMH64_04340 [Nanoarchaeota archaeon]|nr:hypothetical protein [Nanoarchaeota archaeon]|tara:strand:+ start:5514 stop:6251 length:738 start_codon:yes stop_codon:yes gene_type:complete